MRRYIIKKETKNTTDAPYAGIICVTAGIVSGQRYVNRHDAENDAELLNRHSPSRFIVREIEWTGRVPKTPKPIKRVPWPED